MKTALRYAKVALVLTLSGWTITGCSSQPAPTTPPVIEYQVRNVPGVVEYAWEEPMVDVVDVPPGLDPEGHYYRPAHQEVVEIRQGRWQYYRKPSN